MQYVGEKEIEEVILNVYYSDYEANSFLFEDYGETFAYEQDIYLEKKFAVDGGETSFTIKQSMEGLYTPRYDSYSFNVIGLPFKPSSITADGKPITDYTIEGDTLTMKYSKNFKVLEINK